MPGAASGKSAALTINPQNQSLELMQRLMGQILHMAGCDHCGRIAALKVDFLGDPPPDLAKTGVISIQTQGF